jgi:hypothetical protein
MASRSSRRGSSRTGAPADGDLRGLHHGAGHRSWAAARRHGPEARLVRSTQGRAGPGNHRIGLPGRPAAAGRLVRPVRDERRRGRVWAAYSTGTTTAPHRWGKPAQAGGASFGCQVSPPSSEPASSSRGWTALRRRLRVISRAASGSTATACLARAIISWRSGGNARRTSARSRS